MKGSEVMNMTNFVKIGKAIVIQGTKAVTLTAGMTVVSTVATKGTAGLAEITLDNLLKIKGGI